MRSILPNSVLEIIKQSKDIDKDLFEFMVSQYGEYLMNKQINIVGLIHHTVGTNHSFSFINWKTDTNNTIQTSPLKIFFFENLCPIAIRQHEIEKILR
jgi:hypothetical protein